MIHIKILSFGVFILIRRTVNSNAVHAIDFDKVNSFMEMMQTRNLSYLTVSLSYNKTFFSSPGHQHLQRYQKKKKKKRDSIMQDSMIELKIETELV